MHPIAERILDGEDVCPHEILESNASRLDATRERWEARGSHEASACKSKNCTHGPVPADAAYALELKARAKAECRCGTYART